MQKIIQSQSIPVVLSFFFLLFSHFNSVYETPKPLKERGLKKFAPWEYLYRHCTSQTPTERPSISFLLDEIDFLIGKKQRPPPKEEPQQVETPSQQQIETKSSPSQQKWKLKVKKENERFFTAIPFPECPSYDELLEAVTRKLKLTKDDIEAIAKGNKEIDSDNIATLQQDDKLIVFLTQQ